MEAFIFAMIGIFVILIGIVGYAGRFKAAGLAMAFIGLFGFLIIAFAAYSGYATYSYQLRHATGAQIAVYQQDLHLNNFNGMIGLLFFGAVIAVGMVMYYLGSKADRKIAEAN